MRVKEQMQHEKDRAFQDDLSLVEWLEHYMAEPTETELNDMEKEANIQALNEKNFSIYVLEHKIKALEQKYKKDLSKIQINEIIEEKTTLENTINTLIKLLETEKNNDVKIILLKTIRNNKLILFSC